MRVRDGIRSIPYMLAPFNRGGETVGDAGSDIQKAKTQPGLA